MHVIQELFYEDCQMIKWRHIMDEQPEHGRSIVQIDPLYEGHYAMGQWTYYQTCTFKELLDYNKEYCWPNPDYWWVYSEDFPFPDKPFFFRCEECKKSPPIPRPETP
jgi:hypothetical protein